MRTLVRSLSTVVGVNGKNDETLRWIKYLGTILRKDETLFYRGRRGRFGVTTHNVEVDI